MRKITIGAPIKEVTALIGSSVGENNVLEIRSHIEVIMPPSKMEPGIKMCYLKF